jgi:hypothetical protein
LAEPSGITPSRAEEPSKPLATSAIVPSPPAVTTSEAPLEAASRASAAAWPGRWVSVSSMRMPFATSTSSTRHSRLARRMPATGLKITIIRDSNRDTVSAKLHI